MFVIRLLLIVLYVSETTKVQSLKNIFSYKYPSSRVQPYSPVPVPEVSSQFSSMLTSKPPSQYSVFFIIIQSYGQPRFWKVHSTPLGDTRQSQHFAVSIYTVINIFLYILGMRDEATWRVIRPLTGSTVCHLNTFLSIFVLFLVTVNSPTPWSFAKSKISRHLVAEFFVGTRQRLREEAVIKKGKSSLVSQPVLLADVIPVYIRPF